jgi:hypothetical protein
MDVNLAYIVAWILLIVVVVAVEEWIRAFITGKTEPFVRGMSAFMVVVIVLAIYFVADRYESLVAPPHRPESPEPLPEAPPGESPSPAKYRDAWERILPNVPYDIPVDLPKTAEAARYLAARENLLVSLGSGSRPEEIRRLAAVVREAWSSVR